MPGLAALGEAKAAMVVKRAPVGMREPMTLTNPMEGQYEDFARANLRLLLEGGIEPVVHNSCEGKTLALCGAGPSLASEPIYQADEVWGCNSAAGWLAEHGHNVTGAVAIDQTERMRDDWHRTPDVTHYIASTVHPSLTEHLLEQGKHIRVFHNYVGWGDDEIDFYNSHPWPASFMMGTGATVLSRTIGLAAWMGFRRIDVYGADCSFVDGVAHANGETIEDAFGHTSVMRGDIGGRVYETRPDMLMCAVDLVRLVAAYPGRVRLMGDTLPVALLGYDDAYLDEVIRRVPPGWMPPTGDDD